jgi:aryl-alcohol dehydrogenase-like predicted oxidoreductase
VKLGLGTVQFGSDYGISNPAGQTSVEEVAEILAVAQRYGISVIDTAALYGTSEAVLGKALPAGHQFQLVTKTVRFDAVRITSADVPLLEQTFEISLQKLRCPYVYGLLIHSVADIFASGGYRLMESLAILKQRGLVKKIGVSVYTAEQIDKLLERFVIDLVQLPINVLDQRLLQGGQLAKLKAAGVEIHARSAFLQGLLLMEPSALPSHFDSVRSHLTQYHGFLDKRGITPVQAALGFVAGLDEVDAVICGVNNHQQLEELCAATTRLQTMDFHQFAIDDDSILNPSKWPANSVRRFESRK